MGIGSPSRIGSRAVPFDFTIPVFLPCGAYPRTGFCLVSIDTPLPSRRWRSALPAIIGPSAVGSRGRQHIEQTARRQRVGNALPAQTGDRSRQESAARPGWRRWGVNAAAPFLTIAERRAVVERLVSTPPLEGDAVCLTCRAHGCSRVSARAVARSRKIRGQLDLG